eukprot:5451047-Prymnesium_polylepis.1
MGYWPVELARSAFNVLAAKQLADGVESKDAIVKLGQMVVALNSDKNLRVALGFSAALINETEAGKLNRDYLMRLVAAIEDFNPQILETGEKKQRDRAFSRFEFVTFMAGTIRPPKPTELPPYPEA